VFSLHRVAAARCRGHVTSRGRTQLVLGRPETTSPVSAARAVSATLRHGIAASLADKRLRSRLKTHHECHENSISSQSVTRGRSGHSSTKNSTKNADCYSFLYFFLCLCCYRNFSMNKVEYITERVIGKVLQRVVSLCLFPFYFEPTDFGLGFLFRILWVSVTK